MSGGPLDMLSPGPPKIPRTVPEPNGMSGLDSLPVGAPLAKSSLGGTAVVNTEQKPAVQPAATNASAAPVPNGDAAPSAAVGGKEKKVTFESLLASKPLTPYIKFRMELSKSDCPKDFSNRNDWVKAEWEKVSADTKTNLSADYKQTKAAWVAKCKEHGFEPDSIKKKRGRSKKDGDRPSGKKRRKTASLSSIDDSVSAAVHDRVRAAERAKLHSDLPSGRVRRICERVQRLVAPPSSDAGWKVSKEFTTLLTQAAECFVKSLAVSSFGVARGRRRRGVPSRSVLVEEGHVYTAIDALEEFRFLRDTLNSHEESSDEEDSDESDSEEEVVKTDKAVSSNGKSGQSGQASVGKPAATSSTTSLPPAPAAVLNSQLAGGVGTGPVPMQ